MLFGVVFTMRTPEGTLVVEISDPEATIQVLDAQGKVRIEQKAGGEKVEIGVVPGKGKLLVVKNGVELLTKEFSLVAGGRETINARLEATAQVKSQISNLKSEISNPKSPIPPPRRRAIRGNEGQRASGERSPRSRTTIPRTNRDGGELHCVAPERAQ